MDTDAVVAQVEGPASPALVEEVLDALDGLWSRAPEVSAEDRTLFTLAVSEVVTNMVQHGRPAGEFRVQVELRITPEALAAMLSDTAEPISLELAGAEMPDADEESGRGLALARTVLDDFTHTAGADGNTWMLSRRPTA